MTTMEVLTDILAELGIQRDRIKPDMLLKKNLELDSTDLVQVALDLKRRLNINVLFESRNDMSIGQLSHRVEVLLASPQAEEVSL